MIMTVTSSIPPVTTGGNGELSEEIFRFLERMYKGYLGMLADNRVIEGWVYIFSVIAFAVLGYLLGSLNFAVIISKVKFKEDIRTKGSGNAGATNMSRTYGKAAGIATLAGDILKTVIPVLAAKLLVGEVYGYMTGLFCALGHAFPCYYKFKGGKCVAVTAAVALVMEPLVFLFLLLIFAGILICTKYVSLGSIFSALMYPVLLHNVVSSRYGHGHGGIVFVIINCVLVIFLHRGNIVRLREGKENKFSFKKKEKESINKEK